MTGNAGCVYSASGDRHYVACQLARLTSLTALPVTGEAYVADFCRRRTAFLTAVINPSDPQMSYDLRLVAYPDREVRARGRIVLALLCRIEGVSAEEASARAVGLLALLDAYFDEHVFEAASSEEVRLLLAPFPIRHLAALSRRVSLERLDTLRGGYRRLRPGFLNVEVEPEPDRQNDTVFHVFPYLAPLPNYVPLYRLLLAQEHEVAVSCRIQPTALTLEEEGFIEEQIARCERYAQLGLERAPEDITSLRPALRDQAQLYQRYQSRMLLGLKDNAALMTVEVASAVPITMPVLDVLGGLITEPAGGGPGVSERVPERYLAGGYEVLDRSDDACAREGFERLDIAIKCHPLAPAHAERLVHLFDSVEASTGWPLAPSTAEDSPGFEMSRWRSLPAPGVLPREGRCLGVNLHRGQSRRVCIASEDRRRHVYVVGQTGTGKTTLLKTLIAEDMEAGEGLCVIDPHGDLFRDLLGRVPKSRVDDVVVLDPTDADYPVGLNLLEYETESQRHFLVQELVGIVTRLLEDDLGSGALGEVAGPLFFQHMRMNLLLTMSDPADPGTLLEFYTIFQGNEYWRRWLPLKLSDPLLERWVENVLPRVDYTKPGGEGSSMGGYVGSKFEGFVFDPLLRCIFGQKRSTINIRRIMDEGKILLVNLAKGELTEPNSRFLGMVLLAKLMAAAMGRVSIPERDRRVFHLYVDEFQSVATQSFVTLLSEARKFGVSLVLANQFLSQVKDERIVQAIFGNVGTLAAFRVGQADAEILERELAPTVNRADLVNLPNWHAYVTMLIAGQAARAFSLATLLAASPVQGRAETVCERSRCTYARSREAVERELAESLLGTDE